MINRTMNVDHETLIRRHQSAGVALSYAVFALMFAGLLVGCGPPVDQPEEAKREPIFNKKTQEIAAADADVQQADLTAKGPIVSLGAYGSAVSSLAKIQIKSAVDVYWAEKGEYPQDFDTFMEEVIKKNGIKLPVLPGGRQYQYDVDRHELIVVEKQDAKEVAP